MSTASPARSRFSFGVARSLYAKGAHPRVVMEAEDVPRLRASIRSGVSRKIMDGLRRKVAPFVAMMLNESRGNELLATAATKADQAILWNVTDMAAVGVLDECPDTLRAAITTLNLIPQVMSDPAKPHLNVYSMMYGCHPLAYDLLHPHLSDQARSAYGRWMIDACLRPTLAQPAHAFYAGAGANMPICYTLPLLLGMLAVRDDPGVPDLTAEFAELIRRLSASLHATIGVDGYPEEDIGYGTAVVAGLAQVVEPLRRAGLYDAYAECPRYARCGRAILHFIQPWGGCLTNTGDHSDCMICREAMLACQAREADDPALRWLLSRLRYPTAPPRPDATAPPSFLECSLGEGRQAPASLWSLLMADEFRKVARPTPADTPTAFVDRTRGIASFRTGWDDQATYMTFDGSQRSPSCQGHMHASAGAFTLSALGDYFAIDTGRYNVEQDCHNVALINGRSGRSTDGLWVNTHWHGRLIDYRPGTFCDSAAADSSHQHDCFRAVRRVGLVKAPGGRRGQADRQATTWAWTMDDIIAPLDEQDGVDFWWQMHTSPENTITVNGRSATVTGWRSGARLDVHVLLPPSASSDQPEADFLRMEVDEAVMSSRQYITNPHERVKELARPAAQVHGPVFVRPRLVAKIGGANGRFLSIMLPRPQSQTPAKVERLPTLDSAMAARVTFEDVEDTLIFAFHHHLLEADDIVGRGAWCVVRRERGAGRVIAWEIQDGSSLTVAGKRLNLKR